MLLHQLLMLLEVMRPAVRAAVGAPRGVPRACPQNLRRIRCMLSGFLSGPVQLIRRMMYFSPLRQSLIER